MKWKPIATAPKDGTEILAFGMGMPGFPSVWDTNVDKKKPMCLVIHWVESWYDDHVETAPGSGLFKKVKKPSVQYWGPHPQQFDPTHWMPIPKGPKGEKVERCWIDHRRKFDF